MMTSQRMTFSPNYNLSLNYKKWANFNRRPAISELVEEIICPRECDHMCIESNYGPVCACREGFRLYDDLRTCVLTEGKYDCSTLTLQALQWSQWSHWLNWFHWLQDLRKTVDEIQNCFWMSKDSWVNILRWLSLC